jgi:hypothetical protein
MRVYALLCGTLLTVGSASIAQLALQSSYRAHSGTELVAASDPAGPNAIWQGGAVPPITVEARVIAPAPATLTEWDGRASRASRPAPARRAHRAITTGASSGDETALPTPTTH